MGRPRRPLGSTVGVRRPSFRGLTSTATAVSFLSFLCLLLLWSLHWGWRKWGCPTLGAGHRIASRKIAVW